MEHSVNLGTSNPTLENVAKYNSNIQAKKQFNQQIIQNITQTSTSILDAKKKNGGNESMDFNELIARPLYLEMRKELIDQTNEFMLLNCQNHPYKGMNF